LGACQSEKQELELARSLCDSGSITKITVRLLSTRVEQKKKRDERKFVSYMLFAISHEKGSGAAGGADTQA
jgi:hypothetical protein